MFRYREAHPLGVYWFYTVGLKQSLIHSLMLVDAHSNASELKEKNENP